MTVAVLTRRQQAAVDRIAKTVAELDAAQAKLREAVGLARGEGVSWAEIGLALGMSRQAAWERFATPHNDGKEMK